MFKYKLIAFLNNQFLNIFIYLNYMYSNYTNIQKTYKNVIQQY